MLEPFESRVNVITVGTVMVAAVGRTRRRRRRLRLRRRRRRRRAEEVCGDECRVEEVCGDGDGWRRCAVTRLRWRQTRGCQGIHREEPDTGFERPPPPVKSANP